MPLSFVLDRDRRRILTTLEGSVAVADVTGHFDALVREGAVGYADLIDARAASGPGWFSADVRRLADLVSRAAGSKAMGPRAIVVSSTAAFGMVRMLSMLLSGRMTIEAFRDVEAARAWLDSRAE